MAGRLLTSETGRREYIEIIFGHEGRGIQAPFRRIRKTKSLERWLKPIRKTAQLADAQIILFFGLTPSSEALRFSKSFFKVTRIPRPSSLKVLRILSLRFLSSPNGKSVRQSRRFKVRLQMHFVIQGKFYLFLFMHYSGTVNRKNGLYDRRNIDPNTVTMINQGFVSVEILVNLRI